VSVLAHHSTRVLAEGGREKCKIASISTKESVILSLPWGSERRYSERGAYLEPIRITRFCYAAPYEIHKKETAAGSGEQSNGRISGV
jgi:hypothetical protein